MTATLTAHYGSDGIVGRIVGALGEAGFDTDALEPDVLAGADEFHIGGRQGSLLVADALDVGSGDRVLDVGCGIGGFVRFLAGSSGASVTGVDLTPEFVDAAVELTALVGMDGAVDFHVGSATDLAFDDDDFDATTMLHVGMNVDDKAAMFVEMARVTRPGGTVLVYDVMRTGDGDLTYPVPWTSTPEFDFLATREAYEAAAGSAGLTLTAAHDHGKMARAFFNEPAATIPPVTLFDLMGPDMLTMFTNAREAFNAGIMSPIVLSFRA